MYLHVQRIHTIYSCALSGVFFGGGGGGGGTHMQKSVVTSKSDGVKKTSCRRLACVLGVVWNTLSHSWQRKKLEEQVNQKNFTVKEVIGGM